MAHHWNPPGAPSPETASELHTKTNPALRGTGRGRTIIHCPGCPKADSRPLEDACTSCATCARTVEGYRGDRNSPRGPVSPKGARQRPLIRTSNKKCKWMILCNVYTHYGIGDMGNLSGQLSRLIPRGPSQVKLRATFIK